jgi:hypothetical protein
VPKPASETVAVMAGYFLNTTQKNYKYLFLKKP